MRRYSLLALLFALLVATVAGYPALAQETSANQVVCFGETLLEENDEAPEYYWPTEQEAIGKVQQTTLLRAQAEEQLVGDRFLDKYPGFYRDWTLAQAQAFVGLVRVDAESDSDSAVYRSLGIDGLASEVLLRRNEFGWIVDRFTYLVPPQVCDVLS